MNKKQLLKEYIQKEIPEIMELKRGCEIEYKGIVGEVVSFRGSDDGTDDSFYYKLMSNYGVDKVYVKDFNKILGRPITLEDVLILMDKKLKSPFFETETDFELFLFNTWQLGKPLDQQPKETIDFLYQLLIKK